MLPGEGAELQPGLNCTFKRVKHKKNSNLRCFQLVRVQPDQSESSKETEAGLQLRFGSDRRETRRSRLLLVIVKRLACFERLHIFHRLFLKGSPGTLLKGEWL